MIKNLHIENYALIEQLDIELFSGFSVITGETGAGKSIILGAIGLLLGARADSKAIKAGAKKCVIEAAFDVANYHLDDFFNDNELDFDGTECIVRRELTAAGKSRAFINDTPASLAQLKELGEMLIDIHSQHKNLLLGKEDFQLNTLDIIAQNSDLLSSYKKEYKAFKTLEKSLEEAIAEAKNSRDDEEYIRFQLNQMEEADFKENEQEELEQESEMLSHAEEIKSALYTALNCLQQEDDSSDALQMVDHAQQELSHITNVFSEVQELAERLDACYIELKDIKDEIESKCEDVEFNPQRMEFVNDRLSTIYTFQKRHNVDTMQELIELQHSFEEKLSRMDNSDEYIEELRQQKEAQYKKALTIAEKLSTSRKKAAKQVEQTMVESLKPLGMQNVRFVVEISKSKSGLGASGIDEVQYLFNANKSGELKPVSQIASGGEIARVMLSLKALIAGAVKLPTIIFDEIDTGVSGSIAEKMARIMKDMGDNERQVISITHLPQIAALGSHHYKVYKEDTDDATLSHIIPLNNEQRIEEIANMLSGENLTQAALDNARSLLTQN